MHSILFLFLTFGDGPHIELPAKVISVVDGDTVKVELKIQLNVRLLDCWAPESRTKDLEEKKRGLESKEYLKKLLPAGSEVLVKIPFNGKIEDSLTLSRVLAKVYRDIDNVGIWNDISELMVRAGKASKEKP